MKRDPNKVEKIRYFKNISFRKCFPILYTECCKCKMEYKFESMYECNYINYLVNWYCYKHGCTECFSSEEEFRKFLEDKRYILTENNYEKIMEYIQK